MQDLGGQLDGILNLAQAMLVTWGLKVLGAVVVVVVGLLVAGSFRRGMERIMARTETDITLRKFLTSLVFYLVLLVAGVAALSMVGIQMASVLTILATAGLAVGLALQGTLSNVAAGVMLLVFRPFRVGDVVTAGGAPVGTVESIGLFSTALNTPDNVFIVVPNSSIYSGTIHNFSRNGRRRIDLVVGISYDDDIGVAIKTVQGLLEEEPRVLEDPAYQVAVSELGDSSVNLVVRPWCAAGDYWALRFDLTRALKEGLEAAGCTIPYPQRDVHLHGEA